MRAMNLEVEKRNYIVHPHKFNMWLAILSMLMIFGGLMSAYLVSISFVKPDLRVLFDMPSILWNNLAIVLLSSVSMQFALWTVERRENQKALLGLLITFLLGIAFLVGQVYAMKDMVNIGLPMVDAMRTDNSVSFFYVFIGLHGLHIVGTLIALAVLLVKTGRNNFKNGEEGKKVSFEITATLWHFLGLLWVSIFVLLIFTQQA